MLVSDQRIPSLVMSQRSSWNPRYRTTTVDSSLTCMEHFGISCWLCSLAAGSFMLWFEGLAIIMHKSSADSLHKQTHSVWMGKTTGWQTENCSLEHLPGDCCVWSHSGLFCALMHMMSFSVRGWDISRVIEVDLLYDLYYKSNLFKHSFWIWKKTLKRCIISFMYVLKALLFHLVLIGLSRGTKCFWVH